SAVLAGALAVFFLSLWFLLPRLRDKDGFSRSARRRIGDLAGRLRGAGCLYQRGWHGGGGALSWVHLRCRGRVETAGLAADEHDHVLGRMRALGVVGLEVVAPAALECEDERGMVEDLRTVDVLGVAELLDEAGEVLHVPRRAGRERDLLLLAAA